MLHPDDRTMELCGNAEYRRRAKGKQREVPRSKSESVSLVRLESSRDHDQLSLKVLVLELKTLLSLGSAPRPLHDDLLLFSNVLQEVEIWLADQGSWMKCEAQIALTHSSGDPLTATNYIDWNRKPTEISIVLYLHLMRRARAAGIFQADVEAVLEAAVQDTSAWLAELQEDVTNTNLDNHLDILHSIGDYYVAYYSINDAIKHIQLSSNKVFLIPRKLSISFRMMATKTRFESHRIGNLNHAIQTLTESLTFIKGAERCPILTMLGIALTRRFLQINEKRDLDTAAKRLQEAMDLTPLSSDDHAENLSLLNTVYDLRLRAANLDAVAPIPLALVVDLLDVGNLKRPQPLPSLEAMLAELNRLLSFSDLLRLHAYDITLLRNVFREVKTWNTDQQSRMACNAQVALAHSAIEYNPASYVKWSKKSCEISLVMYLHLMQRACKSGLFDEDVVSVLQASIHDSEELIASDELDSYTSQLDMLHVIGDYPVACYSIIDAFKYIKSSISVAQPCNRARNILYRAKTSSVLVNSNRLEDLNNAIQVFTEGAEITTDTERSRFLVLLGMALAHRFDHSRDMNDLDTAVERLQEAVDLVPADSFDHTQHVLALNDICEARIRIRMSHTYDGGVELSTDPAGSAYLFNSETLPSLDILMSRLSELLALDHLLSCDHDMVLLRNVYHEVEVWMNTRSRMVWDAQIALTHSAVEGSVATEYIDWGRKPAEISVMMYLHLVRRAHASGLFDAEMQEMLQAAIQDTEGWLASTDGPASDPPCTEQLQTLQTVGDYAIACYSLVDAMQHINQLLRFVRTTHRFSHVLSRVKMAEKGNQSENTSPTLNKSIQTWRDFLMFMEGDEKTSVLLSLGSTLHNRFTLLGEKVDIDAAVKHYGEALQSTHDGSRATYLCSLAQVLEARFDRFGDANDIELAIKYFQEALSLGSVGSKEYLAAIQGLASSVWARFMRLGHMEDINKAIRLWQEAISLLPPDKEGHGHCLAQLGTGLLSRYNRQGKADDVDSGIQYLQKAQQYLPANVVLSSHLGNAFGLLYERFSRVEDLQTSIAHHRRAAELETSRSTLGNLAAALTNLFERFGKVEDLDAAIEAGQQALDLTPLDHPDRSGHMSNLGTQYMIRFDRLKQESDLKKGLALHQQTFDQTSVNSIDRARVCMNMGGCFARLYDEFEDLDDINRAIEFLQMAVESCLPESPIRYKVLHNLGQDLATRYRRHGDMKDLKQAIEVQTEAIKLKPGDSMLHSILSDFLRRRYLKSQQLIDLELAIEHSQMAVDLTPTDYKDRSKVLCAHGRLLENRFRFHTHTPEDYTNAISAWQSSSSSEYGEPKWRLTAVCCWASSVHTSNNLQLAAEGYYQAIQLLPLVVWIGLRATSQLAQITDNINMIQNMPCDAAACLFSLADANPAQRQHYLGQAVEILDQGRSILWSQASQLRQDFTDLRKVDSKLADELDQVCKVLGGGCFGEQDLVESDARAYRRSAQKWEELVGRVRKIPGFESFLLPSPISELRKAAKGGPIITINVSKSRCDILILPYVGDLILVPLSNETMGNIKAVAVQASQSASVREGVSRKGRPATSGTSPLQSVLHNTWGLLGQPVISQLEKLNLLRPGVPTCRVWWCLTGALTFIPIHAAYPPRSKSGEQSLGMMDLVISSYTPTISTLLRSQRHRSSAPNKVKLLAVGQSHELPMVKEELATVKKLVNPEQLTILESEHATIDTVCCHLSNCTWVHFACHGIQNGVEPMHSGLKMHDKLLTLSKLAQISLPAADFAFLSCCQSATGSLGCTTESVHIAAGMQFVGFRSVIGTLWSVGDEDAKVVAERVYDGFFKDTPNPDSSDAAFLLNRAVQYLRLVRKVSVERWVPFVHFGV